MEDAGFARSSPAGPEARRWPEKAAALLPQADLQMELIPLDGDQRQVNWHACTSRDWSCCLDAGVGAPQGSALHGQPGAAAGARELAWGASLVAVRCGRRPSTRG